MCERNKHWDVHSKCSAHFCWLPLQMGAVEANVEVLLFLTISSVIDRIEASWHWFCAWFPWKVIPVRVWVSFSVLWQDEFMWMSRIGIAEYFKEWSSIGIFNNILIKNYTTKVIHLSASTLGVSLSWGHAWSMGCKETWRMSGKDHRFSSIGTHTSSGAQPNDLWISEEFPVY